MLLCHWNVTGLWEQQSQGKGGRLLQPNRKKLRKTAACRHRSLCSFSSLLFQELEQYKRNAAKTWQGLDLETWHHIYIYPSVWTHFLIFISFNFWSIWDWFKSTKLFYTWKGVNTHEHNCKSIFLPHFSCHFLFIFIHKNHFLHRWKFSLVASVNKCNTFNQE